MPNDSMALDMTAKQSKIFTFDTVTISSNPISLGIEAIVPIMNPECKIKLHARPITFAPQNGVSLLQIVATLGTTFFNMTLITTSYTTRHAVIVAWSSNPSACVPWLMDSFIILAAFASFTSASARSLSAANSSVAPSENFSSDSICSAVTAVSSSIAILSSRAALLYSSNDCYEKRMSLTKKILSRKIGVLSSYLFIKCC